MTIPTLRVKVESMDSPKTGRPVANQYIIRTNEGRYFQSYQTIIAFIPSTYGEKTILDEGSWDYSRTTSKYRNEFLRETTAETRRKIVTGEYLLADLN